MDNKFRVVLAIALSATLMFVFSVYQSKNQTNNAARTHSSAQNATVESVDSVSSSISLDEQDVAISTPLVIEDADKKVQLENDLVVAEFQNGNLISYKLKDFYVSASSDSQSGVNVEMVEYVYNNIYPFSFSFNSLGDTLRQHFKSDFYFTKMSTNSVEFASDVIIDGEPVVITKTFRFGDKPYQIINDLSFENKGSKDISFFYSYFLGSGIGPYKTIKDSTREDVVRIQYLMSGKGTAKKLLEGKKNDITYKDYVGAADFVDIDNRYFTFILNTKGQDVNFSAAIVPNTSGQLPASQYVESYHLAAITSDVVLSSGQKVTQTKDAYVGPKSRVLFNENYKAENYRAIYHESFMGLSLRPLIFLLDIALNKLYAVTKNYALAIMLFTLLFKLVTFPLTHKSYQSMKRMQLVQPKIERIREQYKDNAQAMNTEVMRIYKENKVNPFGGCLPTLLPFPILISFFYLMQSMIELRNAHFLWITDLSSPDRLFVFPPDLPLIGGFNFNIIPIIMAFTSYITMKLQPTAAGANNAMGNQMKMMSTIFPVMMLFMLYNFASGLAIYWTTQNILALIQQLITKYIEKKKGLEAVVENIPDVETKKERKKKNKKKTY